MGLIDLGEAAPHFTAPASNGNDAFKFSTVAGRYIVLCFFASAGDETARAALTLIQENRRVFDDSRFCFFGVSRDPEDRDKPRLKSVIPGIRFFWDVDRSVTKEFGLYDAAAADASGEEPGMWFLLDPNLRVVARAPLDEGQRIFDEMAGLPAVPDYAGVPLHAPVLVVPRVFDRDFCRELIDLYDANGGEASGFMREVDGKTVQIQDPSFKRRSDYMIKDSAIRDKTRALFKRRLLPEIFKAFRYEVTRMERFIVCCYDSESGGFFRPHRDNTTMGTAHRRFACTLNLNAEDYEGGNLRFPEFGPRTYRAPTGGAVVFSCSLLHEATPVTSGKRYVFLPFLYDDEAAEIRKRNNEYLGADVGEYVEGGDRI